MLVDDEPLVRTPTQTDRCQPSAHARAVEAFAVFEVEHRGVMRAHQHSTVEDVEQLRFVVERQRKVRAAVVVSEDALAHAEQHDPKRVLALAENDLLAPLGHVGHCAQPRARKRRKTQSAPIVIQSDLFRGENKLNRDT